MNYNEANQAYDGIIPDDIRRTFIHGSYELYQRTFLETAERNFLKRFRDILQSIRVWRQYNRYPEHIRHKMLDVLSNALFQTRLPALESRDLLQPRSSASAVMALPINTV